MRIESADSLAAPLTRCVRLSASPVLLFTRADASTTYETDMVHRSLGDGSTLTAPDAARDAAGNGNGNGNVNIDDEPHPELRSWVEAEPELGSSGFTRVVISDIRREALACMDTEEGCLEIGRELAHIYHYYLHPRDLLAGGGRASGSGAGGAGAGAAGGARAEGGSPAVDGAADGQGASPTAGGAAAAAAAAVPDLDITVRLVDMNGLVRFEHSLQAVSDDPESLMLRAQRQRFPFAVRATVPGRSPAIVHGVAFYFPFEVCCSFRSLTSHPPIRQRGLCAFV